jgi:hypothetical protein
MANTKITFAAIAIAATGSGMISTSASAACAQAYRVIADVREDAEFNLLTEKLGKPSKEIRQDTSTITTWTDEGGNSLRVITDRGGRIQAWSHHGPDYAILGGTLAVLSCGAK